MPLLNMQPFRRKRLLPFRNNEKLFFYDMTNELFRNYEEFCQRVIQCNSSVWSCELTGKSDLTYQEAQTCESSARNSIKRFPTELRVPVLFLASITKRLSLQDLVEDVFNYTWDRYFIGEYVEIVLDNNDWCQGQIQKVIPPLETVVSQNRLMKPYDKDVAAQFIYEVKKIGAIYDDEMSEIHVLESHRIRRKKSVYSREECILFIKHCLEQNRDGLWVIKEDIIREYGLWNTKFSDIFAGPQPIFDQSKKIRKLSESPPIKKQRALQDKPNNVMKNHKKQECIQRYIKGSKKHQQASPAEGSSKKLALKNVINKIKKKYQNLNSRKIQASGKKLLNNKMNTVNQQKNKIFDRKSKDLDNLQRSYKVLEDRYSDLNAKNESAIKDKKRVGNENAELVHENQKLKKQLEDTRKYQEEETPHRVDLENTLQSTKEENNFRLQLLQEKFTKTRSRRQIEITEIDGQLKEQYDTKLQESLSELREEFEAIIVHYRENLEKMIEDKIRALTEQPNQNAESAANAFEEMRLTKLCTDNYSLKNKELEAIIADLNKKINNLENDIERERERFSNERRNFEDSVKKLREENNRMMADYQDLMDKKIALDVEISAYRKLPESEKTRLNLSAQATPARRSIAHSLTPSREGTPSRKRARTEIDKSEESSSLSHHTESASAKGDVEISSVCPDGKFVKIFNKGDKETAVRDRQRVKTSSQVVRQRESFGGHSLFSRESVGREELYHQRGDPQDKKCRLM